MALNIFTRIVWKRVEKFRNEDYSKSSAMFRASTSDIWHLKSIKFVIKRIFNLIVISELFNVNHFHFHVTSSSSHRLIFHANSAEYLMLLIVTVNERWWKFKYLRHKGIALLSESILCPRSGKTFSTEVNFSATSDCANEPLIDGIRWRSLTHLVHCVNLIIAVHLRNE